jgi:anti-anti-sigma regulatory factor
MTVCVVPVGVKRVARLHRVSVLILTTGPQALPLAESLSQVVAGTSSVVVIDCLDVDALDPPARREIMTTHRSLQRSARQLVVVNVPQPDAAVLREHGLEVSATEDVVYAERPTSYRQANTGCS